MEKWFCGCFLLVVNFIWCKRMGEISVVIFFRILMSFIFGFWIWVILDV